MSEAERPAAKIKLKAGCSA